MSDHEAKDRDQDRLGQVRVAILATSISPTSIPEGETLLCQSS